MTLHKCNLMASEELERERERLNNTLKLQIQIVSVLVPISVFLFISTCRAFTTYVQMISSTN